MYLQDNLGLIPRICEVSIFTALFKFLEYITKIVLLWIVTSELGYKQMVFENILYWFTVIFTITFQSLFCEMNDPDTSYRTEVR